MSCARTRNSGRAALVIIIMSASPAPGGEVDGAGPSVVVAESDSAGPSATVTEFINMVVLESE